MLTASCEIDRYMNFKSEQQADIGGYASPRFVRVMSVSKSVSAGKGGQASPRTRVAVFIDL